MLHLYLATPDQASQPLGELTFEPIAYLELDELERTRRLMPELGWLVDLFGFYDDIWLNQAEVRRVIARLEEVIATRSNPSELAVGGRYLSWFRQASAAGCGLLGIAD